MSKEAIITTIPAVIMLGFAIFGISILAPSSFVNIKLENYDFTNMPCCAYFFMSEESEKKRS